jgi:tyrosine-protein phosphatase SIW14
MESNGIKHIVIEIPGTKKAEITEAAVQAVLQVVLEPSNHPMLIHCNQGKVRLT